MSDYSLNDDGTVTFEFDNFTRLLKRPTLLQYRERIESLGALRDQVLEDQADDTKVKTGTVKVQLDLIIKWLDDTIEALAGEGFPRTAANPPVIDESKLPPWLLDAALIGDLIKHWQTNPSRRGGR